MSDHHDDHSHVPSDIALRVKAIESLLVDKGLVDSATIDRFIESIQTDVGPRNGAAVVAKAWTDDAFKQRLLEDATAVIGEMGITGVEASSIVAVENTADEHNVVVCTLCSCYPWALLGLPPPWYKSLEYRARVVREPRDVLAEFGVDLDPDVRVRVWDSTAEVRYLVIPRRPEGTADLDEAALAELVTRDSMIGAEVLG